MATQSNLGKIGIEERNSQVIRNGIKDTNPYSVEHETAKGEENKPLGKGTSDENFRGGHGHSMPAYGQYGKNEFKPQFDIENGGGQYDIHGYEGKGGRNFSQSINTYGPKKPYSADLIDIEEGIDNNKQFFIK